jgi:hypothetical protein
MQQHFIAQNYPGLIDAITPDISYSDLVSILPDVVDCGLLNNYFNAAANAPNWPPTRRTPITGYPVSANNVETCNSWNGFANTWASPFNGFNAVVPVSARYDPITNPTGARGSFFDGIVNVFGTYPGTTIARSAYDNIGVQYGLKALNSGAMSKAEFLDLNEKIGGYDIDGRILPTRTVGDPQAIAAAYRSGLVNTAENLTLPIIDTRIYTDAIADIHTRIRTFAKLDRLQRTNGTIGERGELVDSDNWELPEHRAARAARHNQWLENIAADTRRTPTPSRSFATSPQR